MGVFRAWLRCSCRSPLWTEPKKSSRFSPVHTQHLRNPPKHRRSRETIARILEAADSVFAANGVEDSTTTEIAAAADVALGSLYHFFPDKYSIAHALADRYLEQVSLVYLRAARSLGDLETLDTFVSEAIHGVAELQLANPGYFAVTRYVAPANPASPAHDARRQQVAQLVGLFDAYEVDMSRETMATMARFSMDMARGLLEHAPVEPDARRAHVDEIVFVISAYFRARLGMPAPA